MSDEPTTDLVTKAERDRIHAFWTRPDDGSNPPEAYIAADREPLRARSEALVEIVKRLVSPDARILEVGCNAGRNLSHLQAAGFSDLTAIEISKAAVDVMKVRLPETHAATDIRVGSVEDLIETFAPRTFDLVFTMAVLVHIHPDSDWVLKAVAERAGQYLVVVEPRTATDHWRHFQRDYRAVFETCGFEQIAEHRRFPGLPGNYSGRVFRRISDRSV